MTGETMRDLLKPLIGKSGSISMLVRRIGPVAFPTKAATVARRPAASSPEHFHARVSRW